jgi:hypothetical protein
MKLFQGHLALALVGLIWLSGCASIGPPLPPSLEVPRPPTDLHAARKGDKITLTWSVPARTTDRQSMRYLGKTKICRVVGLAANTCEMPVGEAAAPADFAARKQSAGKLTESYVDTLPSAMQEQQPAGFATYAVEVLNTANRGAGISNQVHVPLVPTLPPFGAFAAQTERQGVLISWQCAPALKTTSAAKYRLRIYRHAEGDPHENRIAEIDATDCAEGTHASVSGTAQPPPPASFLDQTFEWENTYLYRGTVVSVVESAGKSAIEVEGEDTPEVKVFAHDVFPPSVPTGLQAAFSGPGQEAFVDLIWTPVSDTDLDGYNVYRHEPGGAAIKLNAEPVKAPAFRDTKIVAGKTYSYSVSAIDVRGNESARSEEGSEAVP